MKIRVLFSALILSIAVTLSSIISPIADALPAEPDWVIGEPFIEQSTDGLHSKCANEMRTVVTNKLLYYKEEDMHAKSWCVYTFHEFDIVFYKRLSSTRPLGSDALFDSRGSIESGMAIAYNNGDLTPLDGIDVSLEGLLVYKKDISKLWYMSSCSLITCGLNSLSMYKDNLTQNALTGYYNYNWTSEPLVLKDGTAARGSGFSFSENTEWLSYIVPNTGLVRRNMATGSADVVDAGGSYMVPSYFGSYKPVTSITNDGVYVFAAGPYVNSVVVQSSQRCIVDLMVDITTNPSCRVGYLNPVLVDAIGLSSNGTLQINAVDASGDGSHVRIQMADGRVYYMYPRNSQHLSKMTYLALGDSYSSGEGDIEGGKSSHYLPSTNIWGNYKDSVPRELCHISDRSYPFLLANDMGIKRGPEMQSIACSGALRDDVYAYWMADGVDTGNYLGQNVPMFDNFTLGNGLKLDSIVSEPRLSNLNNRAELQQQARDSFTPGRVQQIELLKKYRPKVATIGISGNDMGFGDVLMACLVDIPGVECHYSTKEGKSELGRAIKANYGKQLKLYQTLKEASPVTDLYAVGYPQFVSDNSMYCWAQTGLSRAEQDMIRHSVIFANETIKQAALSAGIKYLNIENALEGGQVCQGGEYITTPLPKIVANFTTVKLQVEDASTMDSRSPLHDYIYQSAGQHYRKSAEAMANNPLTTIKVYLQETFHPNAIGHEQIYRYVKNLMNGTSLIDAQCDGYLIQCTTANGLGAAPELPTYFGVDTTDQRSVVIKNFVGITDVDSGKVKILDSNQTIQQGSRVKIGISDSENIPGDKVSIYIRSQKSLLGNAIVGENGSIAAEVLIPEDIPVGNHTLIVEPESNKGALYVQSVFVIGPEGDLDGDGVLDQQDTCQLIVPSGEDADGDGIDNACDLQVTSSSAIKFDTDNSNTGRISVGNSDNRGLSMGLTDLGVSDEWPTSTISMHPGEIPGGVVKRDGLGGVQSKDVVGNNKNSGWDMIIVWGVMATLAITGVVAMISRIIKNKP